MSRNIPVQVVAEFDGRGNVIPLSVSEGDGVVRTVQEIVASTYAVGKMGGDIGLRYEVVINGATRYLFYDYRRRNWQLYVA